MLGYIIIKMEGYKVNKQRIQEILKSKDIQEVYYNEKPVWVQEVRDNVAKIGFVNSGIEKDVFIEDLYEDSLYGENKY